MPAPAEFHLRVSRFGVWRALLAGLVLGAVGGAVAWAVQTERGLMSPSAALLAVAVALGGAAALSLGRPRPFELRWDTRQWQLGHPGAPDHPTRAGALRVAIDAGGWLLLQFVPDDAPARSCWLPVQRRGLESAWHGLRATVFSARAAAEPGSASP